MSIIKILFTPSDRALLGYFVKKELVARYKGSGLGTVWNIILPLFTMMIYAFVFGFLFGGRSASGNIQSFILVVVSGFLFWMIFGDAMGAGSRALVLNAGYIKKNKFSKNILFLNIVVTGLVKQLIMFFIYMLMYAFVNHAITWKFILLLPLMLVFSIMVYGFSQVLGSITPFFRDLPNIIQIILRLGFYLSCVLYTIERIPGWFQAYYLYGNPIASCIVLGRYIIYGNNPQLLYACLISITVWTGIAYLLGSLAIKNVEKDVVDVL